MSGAICFFFFNDTATTEIYTLSLHDALPISSPRPSSADRWDWTPATSAASSAASSAADSWSEPARRDRKSTRLNSSHANISYAVFCLKKKNKHAAQAHHALDDLQAQPAIVTS